MDSDWIANRVQLPSERKSGWGPNASFVYAQGAAIIDYLTSMAQSVGVVFVNDLAYVTKASIENKLLQLLSGDIPFDALINTSFIQSPASRLLGTGADYTFHSNTVITVGVGFEGALGLDFHWAYNDVRHEVHRITNLGEYSADNAPPGCSSLMFEIPVSMTYPGKLATYLMRKMEVAEWPSVRFDLLDKKDVDWLLTDSGLSYLVGNRDRVATTVAMAFTGYPIPTAACRPAVRAIKQKFMPMDLYSIGRWGSHGYFNMEHIAAEAALMPKLLAGDDSVIDDYLDSSFYYGKHTTA